MDKKKFLKIKKDIEKEFRNETSLTFSEFIKSKSYHIIELSSLFDKDYYLSSYPDVNYCNFTPIEHYLKLGVEEHCNPNPNFNTEHYLNQFMDSERYNFNPLVHYILYNFYYEDEFIDLENKYKVSIIMPTFNRKNIISNAIDSVLNQTFRNFELIIIDDGSSDGTGEYVSKIYSSHLKSKKIKYYKLDHKGVSVARNFGLSKSTGNVIAYLDSDNIWYSNFLSVMLNELDKENKYCCAYCAIRIRNNIEHETYILDRDFNRNHLLKRNFIDINSFIHEKKLYYEKGGFDEDLTRLVDWDLIIRYTESSIPIHVRQILVDYTIDPKLNNITLTKPLEDNIEKIHRKYLQD